FTVGIPVVSHPTDTLMVDALWPAPTASITSPSAPCVIPIAGTANGFRTNHSAFVYSRTGTPETPIFSPEDPLASTRVRVNLSKTPPMGMEISRLEYDTNPTGVATPKRAIRFVRVVTDADLAFVQSGVIKFVLLAKELSNARVKATNLTIAKFDTQRNVWRNLPTKFTSNPMSISGGTFEATVNANDLRDTTFALVLQR
ncbi:hypothetical protein HY634_01815, partial [Candidatus Uhrbacteria bacterium]|nr:hypothetical protein [Candidatus Uhrbacteria bacterium]